MPSIILAISNASQENMIESSPELERRRIYSSQTGEPQHHRILTKDSFPPIEHVEAQNTHGVHPALAMLSHIEKLRASLREKELECTKLKQENSTLRLASISLIQIERRQQKDLKDLESQQDDGPRIIKGLREESAGLKLKLKEYYMHLSADQRQIRTINKELLSLREQNKHYQSLIFSQELDQRETLSKKLGEVQEELDRQVKHTNELHRKTELVEKNLASENRHLRGKIISVQQESVVYRERAAKLDRELKEKDKEIASLSIYRYNAIHRKLADHTVCKTCIKREKDEQDRKKRELIYESLPVIDAPEVSVLNPQAARVTLRIPVLAHEPAKTSEKTSVESLGRTTAVSQQSLSTSTQVPLTQGPTTNLQHAENQQEPVELNYDNKIKAYRYSQIVLQYSTDPTFESAEQTITLTLEGNLFQSGESDIEPIRLHSMEFESMIPNALYYFQVYPVGEMGVVGEVGKTDAILMQVVPDAPKEAPEVTIKNSSSPASLKVEMHKISTGNGLAEKYVVYHCLLPDASDVVLVGQLDLEIDPQDEHIAFVYNDAQPLVEHYFLYAGVNAKGQGELSPISNPVSIGKCILILKILFRLGLQNQTSLEYQIIQVPCTCLQRSNQTEVQT